MGKKIFGIYLAKLDAPNSEAHARLELPASPLELHDAMDKVQLQENEELYLEIDDYYGFEYLAPHLMELDASLNELNDLAGRLAVLDETEQEAFDGLLRLEIQRKVESNGSILTMQDLRTLAVSAGADCCHVVGATSDAELGRFYAENGFMEELDGLSDDVFEMLDFGKIGKALRTGENGTFTRSGYVVKHSELVTAPPCAKELPEKPEYLFRLTLGLHPDLEDDRTVTLELPASAEALREVQKQLGADGWEGAMVLDYDGIIPQAAEFADLPMELDAFNDFAEAVEAKYHFDADGKLTGSVAPLKNGIYEEDGSLYFYRNGERAYAGLIQIDGDYYYVRSTCEVVHDRSYYVYWTHGLMPEGYYNFDSAGRMILDSETE